MTLKMNSIHEEFNERIENPTQKKQKTKVVSITVHENEIRFDINMVLANSVCFTTNASKLIEKPSWLVNQFDK